MTCKSITEQISEIQHEIFVSLSSIKEGVDDILGINSQLRFLAGELKKVREKKPPPPPKYPDGDCPGCCSECGNFNQ